MEKRVELERIINPSFTNLMILYSRNMLTTLTELIIWLSHKVYRTKRQNKGKDKPKKRRPGFNSLLGIQPQLPMVFSIL